MSQSTVVLNFLDRSLPENESVAWCISRLMTQGICLTVISAHLIFQAMKATICQTPVCYEPPSLLHKFSHPTSSLRLQTY